MGQTTFSSTVARRISDPSTVPRQCFCFPFILKGSEVVPQKLLPPHEAVNIRTSYRKYFLSYLVKTRIGKS